MSRCGAVERGGKRGRGQVDFRTGQRGKPRKDGNRKEKKNGISEGRHGTTRTPSYMTTHPAQQPLLPTVPSPSLASSPSQASFARLRRLVLRRRAYDSASFSSCS